MRKVIPATIYELRGIIGDTIASKGNYADLNFIDVSRMKTLGWLFHQFPDFKGDISKWNVSNVENMEYMFHRSKFNGDISGWNVSNVKYFDFCFAYTSLDCDLSGWDVSKAERMRWMFYKARRVPDISGWRLDSISSEDQLKEMFTGTDQEALYNRALKLKLASKNGAFSI